MTRIKANGIALEYEESGEGVPVLFINGFGTQMTGWPDEFFATLANAGLRVIRFDNRDVGLSEKFDGLIPKKDDPPPYRLADMAADAAGLLDALGIESAHIAGCSMGGMIAQLVALDHPKKTRSLISIFSTTSDPSLPPSSPEAQAALVTRPASNDRETVVAHSLKGRRAYASTRWPFDEACLGALVGRNYDRSFYPEGTARHWAAILAGPPRTERLKTLDVPTLVMHGSADTLIRPEAGRHTASVIPGAEYIEIEGWGHDMPLGAIPEVAGPIVDFVRRVEASSNPRAGSSARSTA
ncbi:MAG TPA: alpha/beta hydrolase [Rhizomicrobium sp.]|nr:alpha/beta hydrolase [Rhizomicrobium sp.]